MSKHRRQKGQSKKALSRRNARWLVSITSTLIFLIGGWLLYDSMEEDTDLSVIGQGKNVVVQIHDPG